MVNVYRRLRKRLDQFPLGFPETDSSIELEILQRLFTPEEAAIVLFLKPFPEKVSAIAERAGEDKAKLGDALYSMSRRGLILRHRASDNEVYYFLAPWMIGIWEFQLNNLTVENVRLYEQYYHEAMVPFWRNLKTVGYRVIPVEKEIEANIEIQPYEKVSEIINSNSIFVVAECICRKEKKLAGGGCDKLLEACLGFGPVAAYCIENGIGREISKEEAREILQKAEESGLIHFSSNHSDNKQFICNCCGCCCKALTNITKHNNPQVIAKSNYYAIKDDELCAICGTCLNRCQVHAIQINNDLTIINKDRCIGCGLCASSCPTGAISMVKKSTDEASTIFTNQLEMLSAIAGDAGRTFPFE
jgi:electron transport complex protein RnfB